MKKLLSVMAVILTAAICLGFAACNDNKGNTDATTVADTAAEATTVAEATAAETTVAEATTVAETTAAETTVAEITTAEDTTAPDPNDPKYTLTAVGKSADGKSDSYNGYYRFEEEYFLVNGEYYFSIQEAIDANAGELECRIEIDRETDFGLCLNVEVPDDGTFYRIAYNWCNIDFTFNYGVTFDDDSPAGANAEWPNVHGYAYYSDLTVLDAIGGLNGCHIFIWSTTEGFAPGYYQLTWVGNLGSSAGLNYEYERIGDIADYWPGLPGEARAQ